MKTFRPILESLEERTVPSALALHKPHFDAHHIKPAAGPAVKSVQVNLLDNVGNLLQANVAGGSISITEGKPFLLQAIPSPAASQIASITWSSSNPGIFVSPDGNLGGTQTALVGLLDVGGTGTVTCTVTDASGNVVNSAPINVTVVAKS